MVCLDDCRCHEVGKKVKKETTTIPYRKGTDLTGLLKFFKNPKGLMLKKPRRLPALEIPKPETQQVYEIEVEDYVPQTFVPKPPQPEPEKKEEEATIVPPPQVNLVVETENGNVPIYLDTNNPQDADLVREMQELAVQFQDMDEFDLCGEEGYEFPLDIEDLDELDYEDIVGKKRRQRSESPADIWNYDDIDNPFESEDFQPIQKKRKI